MDMSLYLETRSVAHTAVAVNARLLPSGFGPLDHDRLTWLTTYQTLLTKAMDELKERRDVPADLKKVQLHMLAAVLGIVQQIHQRGHANPAILEEMSTLVRGGIKINLEAAAASQLDQFRTKIGQWKASYPDLAWSKAVVVIVGYHGAGELPAATVLRLVA